jgi:hypothetical protein
MRPSWFLGVGCVLIGISTLFVVNNFFHFIPYIVFAFCCVIIIGIGIAMINIYLIERHTL